MGKLKAGGDGFSSFSDRGRRLEQDEAEEADHKQGQRQGQRRQKGSRSRRQSTGVRRMRDNIAKANTTLQACPRAADGKRRIGKLKADWTRKLKADWTSKLKADRDGLYSKAGRRTRGKLKEVDCDDLYSWSDVLLARLQEEEYQRVLSLSQQIDQLVAERQRHEELRRRVARELHRRAFFGSTFGQLLAGSVLPTEVLPFLQCAEVLRWKCASSAVALQLCATICRASPEMKRGVRPQGILVHHLRGVSQKLDEDLAPVVVGQLHWPSVDTMIVDAGSKGWQNLLQALVHRRSQRLQEGEPATVEQLEQLSGLKGLSVSLREEHPGVKKDVSAQTHKLLCDLLKQPSHALQQHGLPLLQEIILVDLRSTELLETILESCCSRLRICSASFIGKEVQRRPLRLPFGGLPDLKCLMLHHRDFHEQRASRQDRRICVMASPLLRCLDGIKNPAGLRVLALAGVRIEGNREETAALLQTLHNFPNLASVVLRFSVPLTFGSLLPIQSLIGLRCMWPRLSYFVLGAQSIHGFDYWPYQIVDYHDLYGKRRSHKGSTMADGADGDCCDAPEAAEVFQAEFQHVLAEQYSTSAAEQWRGMPKRRQAFWEEIASRLPWMRRSELRQRVAAFSAVGL